MFDFLDDAADWFRSPKKLADTAGEAVSTVTDTVSDFSHGMDDEGLLGLADPVGMLDRQDAKRDLAPYFAIHDDDLVGAATNHNDVSTEEFDQIARTYSDIRRGQGDLSVNTDQFADPDEAGAYREEIMGDIAKLMRTTSGREQIDYLNNAADDQKTSIRPMFNTSDHSAANLASVGAFEAWGPKDNRIYFSNNDAREEVPDGSGHVMLAHEMQHAHDKLAGTQADGDYHVPGDDYYTENDELQTVGLTHSDPTHPDDPTAATENRIRWELNQLGEQWLPRTVYDSSFENVAGEEHDDKELSKAWDAFTSSPRHPGFE